ncbi:izumo sperm-egg fusion protein 3 isoform X2 [Echinops telfairi]|uniref:Izumo sperm-egg fusion protein 3 isoform X2 n=1 Tax=Echinops telfairi TaxID=9371 RepID=A0ABM0J0X2_ECHTE|nr:izumo sperm-egg fusion protein 3 isoform X2 [Echinops telfairi]
MGDLWLLFLLSLSVVAFREVKGCLECDPKFTEDIKTLIEKLIPSEVPGRNFLVQRQIKEIIHTSSTVPHRNKMLRVLDVHNVVNLRKWLKTEIEKLEKETWKGAFILQGKLLEVRQNLESKMKESLKTFSDVVVTEGPVLDCWSCLRITTHCFKGEYCGDESRKAENREITLFLILLAEAVVFGSSLLLFYVCVSHRRKMKEIRKSLNSYLEKKLEELMGMVEEKKRKDSRTRK